MSIARWSCVMLLLLGAPLPAVAQQQGTVQGSVVDVSTMRPLAGAQVLIPALNVGTLTNQEGRFQLVGVPAGSAVVRVNLIGYAGGEQSVQVPTSGSITVDFALQPSVLALEGIVVTALGMERQARSLGVAAQQLPNDELTRVEPNIVNALAGKVSGVQVRNAGPQGGSSRIVIRGASSIMGNNQPLFVVDGVPIDNSSGRLRGLGGFDYGNAAQDINPADVASITVLKGPNAAALYGSRAANGAILVTTRSGAAASGGQITASQTVSFEEPLRLPRYQNRYGQGAFGMFSFVNGNGAGSFDYYDQSWGPPLDGRLIAQFNSPIDPATGQPIPTPWLPNPNNVRDYFNTGTTLTSNVAFAMANERSNARLSVTRQALEGMIPAHELERVTLGFAGGLQVTDRLRTDASAQYINSDGRQRPGTGEDGLNPMQQFIWFGRQVDLDVLEERWDTRRSEGAQEGRPYSWNYRFHPNPYYVRYKNTNSDSRDRLIGQISATYDVLPWLSAMVRTGTDFYQDARKYTYAEDLWNTFAFNPRVGYSNLTIGRNGSFGQWDIAFQETNSDFLLTANPELGLPFTVTASVGANRRDWRRDQNFLYIPDLTAPGIYTPTNRAGEPDPWSQLERKRVNSVYGQTEFGFNNYLFLAFTGRNDWSSTLPEESRSYFYPSVSGSFIFTDLFTGLQESGLEYGKLRASWARVGNDTDPYSLRNTFRASQPEAGQPFDGVPRFGVGNTLANSELRPEETESFEVGTELSFLDNRLGLDLTWYTATTRNQIMPVQISRAGGYTGRFVNAGAVRNRGVEALLSVSPIRTSNFRWDATLNFARNRNTVLELAEGVPGLQLVGGSFWGLTVFAREGEPYGQMMGRGYLRNAEGQIVVNSDGIPVLRSASEVVGNYNPDWTGGLSNTFSYKGLSLNFLIDTQQGGSVFSVTNAFGMYSGVLEETLVGRCQPENLPPVQGIPTCSPETGIIVPGVKVVSIVGSDTTFATNDIVVDAQNLYWTQYENHEANTFDASYFKLRELTLGYDVPASITDRLRVSGLNVALVGRNLALWGTKAPHIDPETAFDASNVQGLEQGQVPTPRSIGVSISVRP